MRTSRLFVLLAVALFVATALTALWLMSRPPPPPPAAPSTAGERLAPGVNFIDNFASLNDQRWRVSDRVRDGSHIENDFRRSQIGVRNGLLVVLNTKSGDPGTNYTSGEIQSSQAFQYGYFEARMRVPRGAGLVTGFFTYAGPTQTSRSHEIDVEILGRDTRRLYLTYHIHGRGAEKIVDLPFDAAGGFHVYAFEWTPEAIRWYVDGRQVHEARGDNVSGLNRPQQLIVNLWGTESLYRWAGRIDPVEAPWKLEVACVAQAERYLGRTLC